MDPQSSLSHPILLLHPSLSLPVGLTISSPGTDQRALFREVKLKNLISQAYLVLTFMPTLQGKTHHGWQYVNPPMGVNMWKVAGAGWEASYVWTKWYMKVFHFWKNANRNEVHLFCSSRQKTPTVKLGSLGEMQCTLLWLWRQCQSPDHVVCMWVSLWEWEAHCDSSLPRKEIKELLLLQDWSESCNINIIVWS